MAFAVIVTILALVVVARSAKVVPANTAYVVERLGRYHATLTPGLHILLPFLDRIAARHSLQPREEELSDVCITLDNVTVKLTTTFTWQIVDPEKAAYAAADISDFVVGVVRSAQRQWVAGRAWDDARETTRELSAAVVRSTSQAVTPNGVQVAGFDVRRIARS
jgi:regulator of protease activity HflC (stomatin/prohibitin superfamily)